MSVATLSTTATNLTVIPEGTSWGALAQAIQSIEQQELQCDVDIDCNDIEAIDSGDLGALVALRLRLEAHDLHLSLSNVNDHVMEVLEISRLNRVLTIHRQPAAPSDASRGFGNWLRHLMA